MAEALIDPRAFLTAAGVTLAAAFMPRRSWPRPRSDGLALLGRVAAGRALEFGFVVDPRGLTGNPRYAAFVA